MLKFNNKMFAYIWNKINIVLVIYFNLCSHANFPKQIVFS